MDFIETIDLPCVAEIQTMGTCLVPPNVSIDRIIIEPRDNPHLGHYRLLITIDGALVYSDETPRGRYSIDVDDSQSRSSVRNLIAVVVPHDIPSAVRSYLQNESIQITIIGSYEDQLTTNETIPKLELEVEEASIQLDWECDANPELCKWDDDFANEWA